jgi:hypothetical protein
MDKEALEKQFAFLYGQMLAKVNNKENRDFLVDTYNRRINAHKNIRCLLSMVKNTEDSKDSDSLLYASCFVLAFEGSYVPTIDSIIFLFILEGHDLFDPLREKYAHSPEEIGRIDISVKYKFLYEHQLGLLVLHEDSELRNKIAHHDFAICGQNKLVIKEKEYNVKERLERLLSFVRDISQPYVKALQKESEFRGIFPSE